MSDRVKPSLRLYLMAVRMLSEMDEVGVPENGFKKAIRSIEGWASEQGEIIEEIDSDMHERVVHNFNLIMDNLTKDQLSSKIVE
jgi:hypothetical protein